MKFESGQHIMFVGDSITDCGRRDLHAPDGLGYVALVKVMLLARYPERGLTIVNRGIGGDTTRDLLARWEDDVVADRPDWVALMIGINDVWRAYDGRPELAVPPNEYDANLRKLVGRVVDVGCRVMLIEPFYIVRDGADPQLASTREVGEIMRGVAAEYGAVFVATQDAFDAALQTTEPAAWSDDHVHPNLAGHALIAQRVLRAIDFDLVEKGS